MTAARIVAIADAAAVHGPDGAQLAFDLGRFARACADSDVPWALWLRAHDWSADRWLPVARSLAWVGGLSGSLGVSAPADGSGGFRAVGLAAAGVARLHVPAARWPDWQGAQAGVPLWVACHAPVQADAALAQGAGLVVLSPIWNTPSKPKVPALGLDALTATCAAHAGRVVALGGIDARTAASALGAGASAVATLSAWRQDPRGLVTAVASVGRMV